ncbi:uncharacterized protein LOC109542841 [Dendroctonus ponderosae]
MKIFAAFFIALLAVHASTQSPVNADGSNTKEIVVEILNAVLKVSADLLEAANSNLDDLKENEEVIANKLASLIAKELQDLNEIFVSLVDELEDGATDDGKHVLGCIDAEKSKVDAALEKTIKQIAENALTEVPLITDLLDVILRQAGELQEDVKLQTDSLDTCDSEDSECFSTFAATALKIVQEIASNIQEDYDMLVTVTQSIISDVEAWDIRGLIREDTQAIFNEVVECIYSK